MDALRSLFYCYGELDPVPRQQAGLDCASSLVKKSLSRSSCLSGLKFAMTRMWHERDQMDLNLRMDPAVTRTLIVKE